ncbi:MAG: hypothetical protein BRC44_03325 [Cyanobacteria bacterium QS_4_48_99]|nr:MAG: hypothetical protein BRC44_03325 [Cyanobacteria bacterium QS_4_48_99]
MYSPGIEPALIGHFVLVVQGKHLMKYWVIFSIKPWTRESRRRSAGLGSQGSGQPNSELRTDAQLEELAGTQNSELTHYRNGNGQESGRFIKMFIP